MSLICREAQGSAHSTEQLSDETSDGPKTTRGENLTYRVINTLPLANVICGNLFSPPLSTCMLSLISPLDPQSLEYLLFVLFQKQFADSCVLMRSNFYSPDQRPTGRFTENDVFSCIEIWHLTSSWRGCCRIIQCFLFWKGKFLYSSQIFNITMHL